MRDLQLKVLVYNDRRYAGTLKYVTHGQTVECAVAAQSHHSFNIPNPPTGTYRMVNVVEVNDQDEEEQKAYGGGIIFFEAIGGAALRESNAGGKFILALHGGSTDISGRLLPTEGSLRIADADLGILLDAIEHGDEVTLELSEEKIGLIRSFSVQRLSKDVPHIPPRNQPRRDFERSAFEGGTFDSNPPYWFWLFENSLLNAHGEPVAFAPGGGDSGGAGASASYSDGPNIPAAMNPGILGALTRTTSGRQDFVPTARKEELEESLTPAPNTYKHVPDDAPVSESRRHIELERTDYEDESNRRQAHAHFDTPSHTFTSDTGSSGSTQSDSSSPSDSGSGSTD
jgi:hypothetical protein